MQEIDYRDFPDLAGGERRRNSPERAHRWWEAEGKEQADAISNSLDLLYRHQQMRLAQLVMSARLYGNLSLLGMNGTSYGKVASIYPSIKDRISYNLIQSCVDAITSRVAKSKPKPMFLTTGGNYKLEKQAKGLNTFASGIFYENHAYRLGPQAFRDAAVWGDGAIHVYNGFGRCRWERVLCSELYVDEVEALYGEPRSLHRVKNVDRDVLLAQPWAKTEEVQKTLNQAMRSSYDDGGSNGSENLSDMLQLRQSWHLPSGPGAGDGVCVLSVREGVLKKWKWKHDRFPFSFVSWSKRLYGFWGQGLCEQLQNLQLEINKLLWVIQRSMHLAGSFKVLLHTTAKVVNEHLNNDVGAIIRWSGAVPPQYITPPIVPAEIYQHLATLISRGFEQSGISALSAASQKPAGLNSGKALREYDDIQSDRFQVVGQAYEDFFLDLTRLSIDTVKDIVEAGGNYTVTAPQQKFVERVNWKKVRLDEEDYVLQCFPVSALSDDPSDRVEDVKDLAQAGIIEQDEIRPLLRFPDLSKSDDLYASPREWLVQAIEKMLEDGEYTSPEGFDNLDLATSLSRLYYSRARLQNVPEENLELLRTFMKQVEALKAVATPPAPMLPPGAAPPAGQPEGRPEQPPVSQLLPTAPAA